MSRIRWIGALAVTLVVLTGCYPPVTADDRYVAVVYEPDEIEVVRDQIYGWETNDRDVLVPLTLDIHRPPFDGTARPTMLIVHGGGFIIGGTTVHHPQAMEWAQRGYVVVTPTYRLVAERPDQLLETGPGLDAASDIQLSIKWLRARAEVFGIDPNRVAVAGISSGGIPALLAAQSTDLTGSRHAGPESHVANAVFASGTTTLPTLLTEGHIRRETIAAPAVIHHHELDTVSGSTGDDARFTCLVWASEPSPHKCMPAVSPGPGHFLYLQAGDDFSMRILMPFLAAELDLANASDP